MNDSHTSSRLRRFAKNLLAIGIGLVICFACGEILVRLLPYSVVPELNPVQPKPVYLGGMAKASSDPKLFYELVPGTHEINPAGYRGTEYPLAKPPRVKRIVGVGNSTLFGLGVHEQDTYLRRLELLLNDRDSTVQVVNLGVPGYNTDQELEMLTSRGFAFDPDLVILGYDHNDPAPILGRHHPPMPADYGRNVLHSELIRFIMRKAYSRPRLEWTRRVDGHVTRGRGWNRHFHALAEIADQCHARNIPVLVVIYDAKIHRESDKKKSRHYRLLHKPFAKFWPEHGYYVLDCYDLFQEYMAANHLENTQTLWVSVDPQDAHPNPAGHQLMADAVRDVIRENGLLQ